MRNSFRHLMEEMQSLNSIVTNALHTRGPVILNWLKIQSKMQVQYLAGHK
jgi:hypothetical protein